MPNIEVSITCRAWLTDIPDARARIARACEAALEGAVAGQGLLLSASEVSVVLADDEFVRGLNRDRLGKDRATNVLAFPALDEADFTRLNESGATNGQVATPVVLGDVVLAHGMIVGEAAARGISSADHMCHLVIHGVLHLLGYDHAGEDQAGSMERLEVAILSGLRIADPYRVAGEAGGPLR